MVVQGDLEGAISVAGSECQRSLTALNSALILAHNPKIVGHQGTDAPEPLTVVKALSKRFGHTEILESRLKRLERYECLPQVALNINALLHRVAALGKTGPSRQGMFKANHSLLKG
jgi:hypothetical protein